MVSCIAIDDEPLALEVIKKYVEKIYFLECKGCFTDPFEAKSFPSKNTAVVFTTAFSEYAVDGFNADAVDYLLKPIEYDRFLKAVYKAKEYVEYLNNQELHQGYIFVKSDYQMVKIFLKEIIFIEGLDDYIKIYLPQKSVLTLMTLKNISQKLPPREFLRVHRSYIVPVGRIDHVSKSKVKIGEREIPIGISYSESFFAAMGDKMN